MVCIIDGPPVPPLLFVQPWTRPTPAFTTVSWLNRRPLPRVRACSQLPAVVAVLQGLAALRRWLQPLYDVWHRVEAWQEARMEE